MKLFLSFLFLTFITTLVVSEQSRFDNYRVYRINIENEKQLRVLHELEETSDSYNFWQSATKVDSKLDLVVPPHQFSHFGELVQKLNLKTKLMIKNLQNEIDNERPLKRGKAAEDMNWTEYHSYEVMYEWLDSLEVQYPEFITVSEIGTTYEGRPIKLVKLSKKTGNRAIFIEANIHAREWISSATATWVLNQLLTSDDPNVIDLAENIDWYIVPMANPDGHEFTRTSDRQWRKTRSVHSYLCTGVDANRNFAHNWEYHNLGGSTNPCQLTYVGPKPFSESEAAAIENVLRLNSGIFDAYLAFHSYTQCILFPYGHTEEKVENYDELKQIGDAAARKLFEKHGKTYKVGNTIELLYYASGVGVDHAYGNHSIRLGYTIEHRDTGEFGFVLPPVQIIPNAEEVLEALIGLVDEARKFGYFANNI